MIVCPVCNDIMSFNEFVKHTRKSIPHNCIKYCYENNLKKDIKKRNVKIYL